MPQEEQGGYKNLPFYKQTEIIYDFTVEFCNRYIDKRSRTHDQLVYKSYNDYNNYKKYINSSEDAANAMICLINQTNRLLDQKLRWLEEKFIKEGGFRENLFKRRMQYKNK